MHQHTRVAVSTLSLVPQRSLLQRGFRKRHPGRLRLHYRLCWPCSAQLILTSVPSGVKAQKAPDFDRPPIEASGMRSNSLFQYMRHMCSSSGIKLDMLHAQFSGGHDWNCVPGCTAQDKSVYESSSRKQSLALRIDLEARARTRIAMTTACDMYRVAQDPRCPC